MKKLFVIFALCLTACGNDYENMMQCDTYDVQYNMSDGGEALDALVNGQKVSLQIAISASGVRYVGELGGELLTLWNHGSDWIMFFNEDTPIECSVK